MFSYGRSPFISTNGEDVNTAVMTIEMFDTDMKQLEPEVDNPSTIQLAAGDTNERPWETMSSEGDGFGISVPLVSRYLKHNQKSK